MKKIFMVMFLLLLAAAVSCGSNSGSDRKQGEIYGECFKDKTCSEGLVCDEEHNVCIKDDGDSDDINPDHEEDKDEEDKDEEDEDDSDTEIFADQDDPDSAAEEGKPWEDPESGMMWSAESNAMVWQDAVYYCDNLTEGGFSDWRLPSVSEARTLIKNCWETMIGGRCGVKDNCLSYDCLSYSCGLCEPQADGYYSKIDTYTDSSLFWSASEVSGSAVRAWGIELYTAAVAAKVKNEYGVTRCARGENHRRFCEGLPEHAFWNSASTIFSTWDGSSWQPSLQGVYNDTASTKECVFKCVSGYKWDGYKCKPDDTFPECSAESQTPCIDSSTGLVWSSKTADKSWKEAADYCFRRSEGGTKAWSLPTIDELRTLVTKCPEAEYGGLCAVSEEKGFLSIYDVGERESCLCMDKDSEYSEYNKFGDSGLIWSSSVRSDNPDYAWGVFTGYISYGYGIGIDSGVEIMDSLKTYDYADVRCVVK